MSARAPEWIARLALAVGAVVFVILVVVQFVVITKGASRMAEVAAAHSIVRSSGRAISGTFRERVEPGSQVLL